VWNIVKVVFHFHIQNSVACVASTFPAACPFADLVGFTSMSKEIPPEEVIIFLNSLFGYFDRLVEKHRVQKVCRLSLVRAAG
jgi:class 3 adenylate cyclase